MTPSEHFDANKAYLSRLQNLRQREKENLSDVDFRLFSSRFDPLIEKIKAEIDDLVRNHSMVRESLSIFYSRCRGSSMQAGACSVVVHLKVNPEPYVVISGFSTSGEFEGRIGRVYSDCFV